MRVALFSVIVVPLGRPRGKEEQTRVAVLSMVVMLMGPKTVSMRGGHFRAR